MMTVENLKACGVNVTEGLSRCMNNEAFYLRLVNMALQDKNFDKLKEALEKDDRKAGFEAAHALKGMLGNLSLTPVSEPVQEATELLRVGADVDYTALLEKILSAKKMLEEL